MNILISGDSWSQGEWDGDWRTVPSTYRVYHPGINQYLQEAGHLIVNVGKGSISNMQALDNLKQQITCQNFDYLIFFFTDPLRDCSEQEIKSGRLFDLVQTKTKLFLDHLKQVKSQCPNLKIILLGGYSKIETFDNDIDHVIPSIIELLVPGYQDSSCADSPEWKQYLPTLSLFTSDKEKQEIVDFSKRVREKLLVMEQHKNLFYPDGYHPNRHAHRLLANKILKLLAI